MPTYKIIGNEIYSDFTKIAVIDRSALPTALTSFEDDFNRLNETDPSELIEERFETLRDAVPTEESCEIDKMLKLANRIAESKTKAERYNLPSEFENAIDNLRENINYPWDELKCFDSKHGF